METRLVVDDEFAVVETVLTADVAHSGTFTVGYPSGFAQGDFDNNLAGASNYVHIDDNDRWAQADSKMSVSFGASLITVTNSSNVTWRAGQRVKLHVDIRDGNNVEVLTWSVPLAAITGNIDVLTDARPGIDGTIEHFEAHVMTAVTTGSRLATLTPFIDGVTVTGGALALTSANATPLGKVVAASAITGANRMTRKSKLSIKATGVTAFAEGLVTLMMRVRRTSNV